MVTLSTGLNVVVRFALAFVRSIEAVGEQVEEHARDVLRRQLDRRNVRAVGPLQDDVEVLILGAGAVIGEIERFLDKGVEVDVLPFAPAAARMREHALDDVVGALAVRGDPVEIVGQRIDDLVDFAALFFVQGRKAGSASSFNSSSSPIESPAKLLTKLRGFLISWATPAVS